MRSTVRCAHPAVGGQVAGSALTVEDIQPDQLRLPDRPASSSPAKATPIAAADAHTIEAWLVGDTRQYIFGFGEFFFSRADVVLAQPHAKTELAQIVVRKDLPPHLRVYAQEMLMQAGQPRNPALVEDYCSTLQNSDAIGLLHEIWGLPGVDVGVFSRTLISYRQAALPCLSRLLNDGHELVPSGNGEANAVVSIMQYRVEDLAAYLITQILNVPYNKDCDPNVRDQQIQALRRRFGVSAGAGETQVEPIQVSPSPLVDGFCNPRWPLQPQTLELRQFPENKLPVRAGSGGGS